MHIAQIYKYMYTNQKIRKTEKVTKCIKMQRDDDIGVLENETYV